MTFFLFRGLIMYIQYYDSPLGKILLAADEIGLIGVWFENQKYYADGLIDPVEKEMAVLKETKEVAKVFQKDVLDYVLFGGEDYQLVFTITPEKLTKLQGELNDLTIVGEVCSSFNGVKLERNDGTIIDIKSKGYNHFR